MAFVNLHLHTEYSLLDGGIKIKDLFKHIKSLGQTAVSVTDHGNMGGTIHKYKLAKKEGIKFIIGVEAYLVDNMASRDNKTEQRYHVIFYAKNLTGYKNMIKLMSAAAVDGFYYRPRVDIECLKKYSDGLICTTACLQNDIAQALIANREDKARSLIQRYIDIFGKENFFLEVANHNIADERLVANAYFKLAEEFGLRVIFGSDAHYLMEDHNVAHQVLLCQPAGTMIRKRFHFKELDNIYKRRRWSKEDVNLLIENQNKNTYELSKILLRGGRDICKKCSELGIKRGKEILYEPYMENIDIKDIKIGDKVVAWDGSHRRGNIKSSGIKVVNKSERLYDGNLVEVNLESGHKSRYTHDHICVVSLKDSSLIDGNFVTYIMKQDGYYRVGYTVWDKLRDNGNRSEKQIRVLSKACSLGPLNRRWQCDADKMWVLSVHKSSDEAREEEEFISYKYNIPTWTFPRQNRNSDRKQFYHTLWKKIDISGMENRVTSCLKDYNRDILYPFFDINEPLAPNKNKICNLRACNLLSGMRMCIYDSNRHVRTYNGSGLWKVIKIIKRIPFNDKVYSIEVEDYHTYIADNIVTHNCSQTNDVMSNPGRFKFDGEGFHILSEPQARSLFPDHPEIFDNTQVLADMCNVELELGKPIFPDFPLPEGETKESYLKKLCDIGFEEKYTNRAHQRGWEPTQLATLKERLNYELDIINKMGFAEYFLIVQDVVRAVAKKDGISTAGRGSAGGSMVGYVLGIHQLEPTGLDLLFERFLNPDRISLPDIDNDFGDRNIAIEYIKEKYGSDKVALIGTYGTMASKLAVKDTARVYGIPFEEVNNITKNMVGSVEESRAIPEVNAFFDKYPDVYKCALINEDVIKFQGTHASGVVWGKEAIIEYCPVRVANNELVTQYDMQEIEDIGLVKMDILGVDTYNIIKRILVSIGKDDEWLVSLPLDDAETYAMLANGESLGVFQLEGGGMINTLKKVKPTCFEDIVAILALYRPGSMDYVDVYANRKSGIEPIVYDHPKLEPILKPTYGILVYQESVMMMSRVLAGFTPGEADTLRKAIGKKKLDLMLSLEKKFKEGCIKNAGMTQAAVDQLWDKIVKFADYSFNKSHAAGYALLSYRTAYLRKHYPVEYMVSTINSTLGNIEKTVEYIREAKKMGIKILPPDVNISGAMFTQDGDAIRFGLEGVKNVAGVAMESIIANRPYKSFVDFVNKVDISKVNKRVQKHLIMAGAFDSFGVHRNQLLAGYLDVSPIKKTDGVQLTLFGTAAIEYTFPNRHEPTLKEKMGYEKESMGITASGDMMDLFPDFADMWLTSKDLNDRVTVFGLVKTVRKVYTKKDSREMAFATIYNGVDQIDIVVFPNAYAVYGGALYEDAGLIVTGNLQNGSILADIIELVKPKEV
jgi:DNA polymerase-3 subunit alpha